MFNHVLTCWRQKSRLSALMHGPLARTAVITLAWQCVRIFLQLGWVVGAARLLGADGFGLLAGAAGLATGIAGFVGLGTGLLMYQSTASDRTLLGTHWHQSLIVSWLSAPAIVLFYVLISVWLLGVEAIGVILGVALAELVFQPILALAAFAFAGCNRLGWAAAVPVFGAFARLMAIVAFSMMLPDARELLVYVWFHVATVALSALLAVVAVGRVLKPEPASSALRLGVLRRSAVFAISSATSVSVTTFDKALVLRLGGEGMSGQYASAYRFVVMLALPIEALTIAAMPRLFRDVDKPARRGGLVSALAAVAVGYGMLAGLFAWIAADWLTVLLGAGFGGAAEAARWLAILVPLYSLRTVALHVLLTSGRAREKVLIELGALVLMLVAAVTFVPSFGLQGAAAMIILSEFSLALLSWWRVAVLQRKPRMPGATAV